MTTVNRILTLVATLLYLVVSVSSAAEDTPDIEIEYEVLAQPDTLLKQDSLPPLEKMPQLLTFIEADYPPEIYRQGVQGTVLMDLLISDSGRVDSVFVVKGLHPTLDTNAVRAVRLFRFSPAIAEGQPVSVILQYAYRFSLTEAARDLDTVVNFTGRILERGTRNPLADALVVLQFPDTSADSSLPLPFSAYLQRIATFPGQHLEEGRLVTTTDSLGRFSFYSVPLGPLDISVPVPGYEAFRESEIITPTQVTEAIYYVRRISYADYEVVVYGRAEEKEVSRRQLTAQEVRRIPGLGGDAVKVVQALPGVARPSFGGGAVVIRGARTWDSKFLLDGVQIPLLYHFGGLKSTYNSDALESVDLYPGGFSTRYGGAVGGVVEITGRKPKTDRLHLKADASFLDASALIEGPITKELSFLVTGRRSYVGDLLGLAAKNIPALNLPISVAPYYWDYVARTDYSLSRNHQAFVTLFGSRDGLELIIPGVRVGSSVIDEIRDRISQKEQFHLGIVGWDATFSDRWSNQLRYSLTKGNDDFSLFGFVRWKSNYWQHQVREQVSCKVTPTIVLNAGVEIDVLNYRQESIFPTGEETLLFDTLDGTYGLIGPYMTLEWKPRPEITIAPGIRYDHFLELDYRGSIVPAFWNYHDINNRQGASGEPSVRLLGRYEYLKGHTAKGAIGNYSQTPQPAGLATHEVYGSPHLPATKAAHYVVGYEWKPTDLIFVDAQLYLNRQFDIPQSINASELVGGSQERFVPAGKARMRGLELLVRHDQGRRFFGWIAYTLSQSERYNRNTQAYALFEFDQTHNLQLVGNYRLPQNWEIGTRIRYVSGNPYTPILETVYDSDFRQYGVHKRAPLNSGRLDPFFQTDFRVDKKFVFKKSLLSCYVDLQNVSTFLYKSPEFLIPNFDPVDPKTGKEDRLPISFPFLVSLGATFEY